MANKIRSLLLLVLLLGSGYAKAQDNIIDQVIWIVGDEAILKSDVEKERIARLSAGERIAGDPYCILPEQIALQKLFLDQAKIDSIDVSPADVNRAVSQQENRVITNLGSREKAEEYLGASIADLREEWREMMRNSYLVEKVQSSIVGKKTNLTPSEVRRYYSQLPPDSLPFIPTTVEVQIITNEPAIPLSEIDRIKDRLREYTERVNKGESFATLAILYSEDGSATNGGELGFNGRASWVPEFANAAFSLTDPKRVSNIVETEYGYHILQLIERRGDRANVRHILLKPKVSAEEMQKAMGRMDTLATCIKENKPTPELIRFIEAQPNAKKIEGFTFEDAVELYSSDKDTRQNQGLLLNSGENNNHGTARFAMEDLPPEAGKIISSMKEGEVSMPFKMMMRNGREGVAIVKLKKRIEGHVANVSDDYVALKNIVEQNKRQEVLNKWVKKKITDTYVYIDNDWKNCDFKYSEWIKD